MRSAMWLVVVVLANAFVAPTATPAGEGPRSSDRLLEELVSLERSALDRWIKLDPQGYLDLYAQELTYFDPTTEKRVDEVRAMQERVAGMKNVKLPFTNPRYELLDPRLQRHGDVAVLTFQAVNYGMLPDRPESVLARWNSTEVYGRVDGKWKIIHSHWSFVKPELRPPGS
jgi:ketosteroid isomerase-like protein